MVRAGDFCAPNSFFCFHRMDTVRIQKRNETVAFGCYAVHKEKHTGRDIRKGRCGRSGALWMDQRFLHADKEAVRGMRGAPIRAMGGAARPQSQFAAHAAGTCPRTAWRRRENGLRRTAASYPRGAGPRHARRSGLALRLTAVAVCCAALLAAFSLYSRVRRRFDVRLPVRAVLQNPALPNGCEAASLAALLRYQGVAAEPLDLAYGYIPREDLVETPDGRTGPDPERAYAGDPATGLGFYCFAPPLVQGANRYLRERGSALQAVDLTGVTAEGLAQYVRSGDPVAVWVTRDLSPPRTGSFTWTLADTGETYTPFVNLHCVVLIGWGRETCSVMDPLQGVRTVEREAFEACFAQMGSRAMVVH